MTTNYLPQKIKRLESLYSGSLPDSNLKLMLDYTRYRRNAGMRTDTVIGDVKALTEFSKCISTPIESMTEEDLYTFFEFISKGSKATIDLYKVRVKGFLDYAGRKDLANLIKLKRSKAASKLPEDILTQEEVEQMINACQNLRDKAYIAVLYETGARRGELMDLLIKHVTFDEYGAIVTLPKGKTGARRVRIVWSSGFLRNWLENHPKKENREAFVWASFRDPEKTAEYRTLWQMLGRAAEKAGVQKRVNPHSFRHSRATHLATDLTEQQLKAYLGWTAGSSMASVYVHLSGRDIDSAILKASGIEIEEREKENTLKILKCPRCKEIQDSKASFCFKCGLPLKEETSIVIENDKSVISKEFLLSALTDPDVQAILKNSIK